MYGDTHVIRQLARRLSEQADEIRDSAADLLLQATGTPWRGLAADAMRYSAAHLAADLRHTATLHDDAAAALRRHAQRVDETKALIASIEQRVNSLVSGARDRLGAVAGLVDAVADPVDELLSRFDPPGSGSISWLDVDLPGLPDFRLPAGVAS